MAITIRDVARQARVSVATVSRVLNNTARVNEEKRQRVEKAVLELGFTPNQMARGLVQKKTGGLGVLLPSVGGEFFAEFLKGVDVTARDHGYFLMISAFHGSLAEMEVVLRGMRLWIDGLIVLAPDGGEEAFMQLDFGQNPVIVINGNAATSAYDTVNFDNYRGGFLATQHLLELGHRRIAMLKGPSAIYDAGERLRGYRDALLAHNIEPDERLEMAGDFSSARGYQAAEELLAMDAKPTAVFCVNDQSAIGLMAALLEAGIQVPKDISIVGFDGIPATQYSSPSLTTVRAGIRQLGIRTIERFLEITQEEQSDPRHIVLPAELAIRQSTASIPEISDDS